MVIRLTTRATPLIAAAAAVLCTGPTALAGGGGEESVRVKDFDFGPKTAKIYMGDKVKWVNQEGSHTVTFENGFDEVLSEDESANRLFKKPGTYRYICTFHDDQGMKGKVVVRR